MKTSDSVEQQEERRRENKEDLIRVRRRTNNHQSDEPASVLLERIRFQCTAAKPLTKPSWLRETTGKGVLA